MADEYRLMYSLSGRGAHCIYVAHNKRSRFFVMFDRYVQVVSLYVYANCKLINLGLYII
jgi:hypothetical protein